ncbi:MAG: hypothetical protein II098_05860 [Treponema sp.]|jgi:hypothetical protein|nr:hypothetical protein [Treponema sp.]
MNLSIFFSNREHFLAFFRQNSLRKGLFQATLTVGTAHFIRCTALRAPSISPAGIFPHEFLSKKTQLSQSKQAAPFIPQDLTLSAVVERFLSPAEGQNLRIQRIQSP